jgi:hypothetical protein
LTPRRATPDNQTLPAILNLGGPARQFDRE